jgi:hypothetical protein
MDKHDRCALRVASDHRSKGRVLFIAATQPEPGKDGGDNHPFHLMRCCTRLGYRVSWLVHGGSPDIQFTRGLQQAGIEVMQAPWLTSLPDFFAERGPDFDYVFARCHELAVDYLSLINEHCPRSRFVLDEVNRALPPEPVAKDDEPGVAQQRPALWARQLALSAVQVADATLVGSQDDRDSLAEEAPAKRIHVLTGGSPATAKGDAFEDCQDLAALFALFG